MSYTTPEEIKQIIYQRTPSYCEKLLSSATARLSIPSGNGFGITRITNDDDTMPKLNKKCVCDCCDHQKDQYGGLKNGQLAKKNKCRKEKTKKPGAKSKKAKTRKDLYTLFKS